MKNVIYHNPSCSKSRGALQILKEKGIDVEVVEYLKTPPPAKEIKELCQRLNISPKELVRTKETLFKELGLSLDSSMTDEQWCQTLAQNPKLIERPIVCLNGKAVIARPSEKVLEILSS